MSDVQEVSTAKGGSTMKVVLVVSIMAVVAGTVVLKQKLGERDAAQVAHEDHPASRAKRALRAAEEAAFAGDQGMVYVELERAAKAMDQGLALNPADLNLARARVTVARRLANASALRDNSADAQRWLTDAQARAKALFDQNPTDQRARMDLLYAARELAAYFTRLPDPARAARIATTGASQVEDSVKTLPASARTRGALVEIWMDASKAWLAAKKYPEALGAARNSIRHAEVFVEVAEEPLTALARLYAAVAVGTEAAEQSQDMKVAEALELRAIGVLLARSRLAPDDAAIKRALAARHARAAHFMAKNDRLSEAKAQFDAAIAVREGLVKGAKDPVRAARDLTRALNGVAAFYSNRGDNKTALALYKRAVDASKPTADGRARLVALGNYAQILGRLDLMVRSKRFAREAYELAVARLKKASSEKASSEQALVDCAVAGLRHARLLRAKPKPKRAQALRIAKLERGRLKGSAGKDGRRKSALKGLDTLIAELR